MIKEETSDLTDNNEVISLNRLKFVTPYLTLIVTIALPFYLDDNWYFLCVIPWLIGWNFSLPTLHIGDGCLPIVILLISYFFHKLIGPISWQMGVVCWLTWYIVSVEMYYKIYGRVPKKDFEEG